MNNEQIQLDDLVSYIIMIFKITMAQNLKKCATKILQNRPTQCRVQMVDFFDNSLI